MELELKSPQHERAVIRVPADVANHTKPFNGTLSSPLGDEYPVKNNIVDILKGETRFGNIARLAGRWRITASLYEEIRQSRSFSVLSGDEFPAQKEQELLLEWIQPQLGGVYLDLGCSTAFYARLLKKAAPQAAIIAVDISMEMLKESRKKAVEDEVDLFLIRADGSKLPFYSRSFDGIVVGGTLNEAENVPKILGEIRRVIKEDGSVFIMHLIQSDVWYGRLLQSSVSLAGLSFLSLPEINTEFKRAGFTVAEQQEFGLVCFTKLIPV